MPSAEITLERSMFVGLIFTSILYGIYVTFYVHSIRLFLKRPHPKNKLYIIYSSLLLVLLTISVASNCALGDLMWIDDRDIPGGPPAYYADNISAWYNVFGTTADMIVFAMADGLLLYRCFIFWRDHSWVITFPALIYLSAVSMSIMMTIESAVPGADIFQGMPTNFGIPWTALTVSFNVIVTLMIVGRLLVAYRTVHETLSPAFSMTYVDISATLVESALPFSALGIGYAVCVAVGSNVASAFAFVWGTLAALAPQFIIYRVALGVAWTKETAFTTTHALRFADNPDCELKTDKIAVDISGVAGSTIQGSSDVELRSYHEGKV